MAMNLYAAIVPAFRQVLTSVAGLIGKAEAHCAEQGWAPEEIIGARLAPDMHPFAFQVKSAAVHSMGAIEGVRRGLFTPDRSPPGESFAALSERIAQASAGLAALEPEEINALEGKPMRFEIGDYVADFTAETFLLSFSKPNFYFHTATAYDILRTKGLAIGKADYLGSLPLRRRD